eukprot:3900718-Karenia_brevis.AAC.1
MVDTDSDVESFESVSAGGLLVDLTLEDSDEEEDDVEVLVHEPIPNWGLHPMMQMSAVWQSARPPPEPG